MLKSFVGYVVSLILAGGVFQYKHVIKKWSYHLEN